MHLFPFQTGWLPLCFMKEYNEIVVGGLSHSSMKENEVYETGIKCDYASNLSARVERLESQAGMASLQPKEPGQ